MEMYSEGEGWGICPTNNPSNSVSSGDAVDNQTDPLVQNTRLLGKLSLLEPGTVSWKLILNNDIQGWIDTSYSRYHEHES